MGMGVSRRNFLKGAALAGVGATAATALAACSPKSADTTATAETANASGATPDSSTAHGQSWLGEAPEIADADIVETIDTELLVVGGGQSGVIAARKAAELGMKVVVMEMQPEDTWSPNGCDMGTVNAQAYLETGAEPLDEMQVMNEWQLRTYCRSMPSIAKMYATRSGECADYVRSIVPAEKLDAYSVYYSFPDGRDSVAANHSGYTSFPGTISYRDWNNDLGAGQNQPAFGDVLKYSIEDSKANGAQWLFATTATVLVQNENGDVTGCIGKNESGYVKVNAKAVLMAAGDFSGNGEMVLALNDEVRELAEISGIDTSDPSGFRGMGRDGSGIKMMLWAGAMMEPGPRAAMNFGNGMGVPGVTAVGNYPVFGPDGRRFYNDAQLQFGGLGFMARRWPGEQMCCIADGKWAENIRKQGYEHNMSSTTCAREWDLVTEQLNNMTMGPDGFEVYGFTGFGMNTSTMYAAETLDELADILGYEGKAKQGLLDEIAHYNEMCAAGKDTDWGRDADLMYALDTPPFFGVSGKTSKNRVASGMVQMSGVLVNDRFQVRRSDETIIKGLYACGNDCGGRYAIQYHTLMAGNSLGVASTQGMVAGEHIATMLDDDFAYADTQAEVVAQLAEEAKNQPAGGPPM